MSHQHRTSFSTLFKRAFNIVLKKSLFHTNISSFYTICNQCTQHKSGNKHNWFLLHKQFDLCKYKHTRITLRNLLVADNQHTGDMSQYVLLRKSTTLIYYSGWLSRSQLRVFAIDIIQVSRPVDYKKSLK
jgi:hypothetical protein